MHEQPKELTREQAKRYSRHILLPEMDWEGQERLLNSHALVLGLGGLGCAVAQYLAASGVGTLTLVDHDNVELSNLQRQVLHNEERLAQNKAVSAKIALAQLNSDIQIQAIPRKLNKAELLELANHVDVLVDCTDNLQSRNLLNAVSVETQTALITGAAIRFEGQVCCFFPNGNGRSPEPSPCYACLSSLFGEQELSCMEAGVLAPLVGIIGSMQALHVVKYLSQIGHFAVGKLCLFDAMTAQWQEMKIRINPQCPTCSSKVE
ncbi:molybdopterin-synthase adenylyltransferase MoeB [Alteromonas sp. a30]|nr:molybdopterin-synthase adenylyltransferase MoeB [Alteromonas sp. a30]